MNPKLRTEYELTWNDGSKSYSDYIGPCSKEKLDRRIELRTLYISNNNLKVKTHSKPILDKHKYIKEFENITPDDNIYIPVEIGKTFSVFLSEKGIEVNFHVYIYDFDIKRLKIYKCNYIYSQDLIFIHKIDHITGKPIELHNVIITPPKSERLFSTIRGNKQQYEKLVNFFISIFKEWEEPILPEEN